MSAMLAVRSTDDAPAREARAIGELAYAWGFGSAPHFSRAFRAFYGVSPSEWRSGLRPGTGTHSRA